MTEKQQPILDRFRSQLGQDVTIDYFLYVCLETEKRIVHSGQRSQQWERLSDKSWLDKLSESSLGEAVAALVKHYAKTCPNLTQNQAVDFSRLDDVVQPFVELTLDLKTLLKSVFPETMPIFDASSTPWSTLIEEFESSMPGAQQLMIRYIGWSYSDFKDEIDEPGSRPPVGKHAPYFPKKPLGRGSDRQGSDRQGSDRQGSDRRDRGGPRNNNSSKRPSERSPKDLASIVAKEAQEACEKLKAQSDLESVKLAPQNSFYRRMQHNYIGKEGLHSTSQGEGAQRCVVVTREPSSNKS